MFTEVLRAIVAFLDNCSIGKLSAEDLLQALKLVRLFRSEELSEDDKKYLASIVSRLKSESKPRIPSLFWEMCKHEKLDGTIELMLENMSGEERKELYDATVKLYKEEHGTLPPLYKEKINEIFEKGRD